MINSSKREYDLLLDEFEPGVTSNELDHIFAKILPKLKDILKDILNNKKFTEKFSLKHCPIPI